MSKLTKAKHAKVKAEFQKALNAFVVRLHEHVSSEDGEWSVKGFIDVYKNIYTISSDTKIVSKILEIHLFPLILQFADENDYSIVLAEHQNCVNEEESLICASLFPPSKARALRRNWSLGFSR